MWPRMRLSGWRRSPLLGLAGFTRPGPASKLPNGVVVRAVAGIQAIQGECMDGRVTSRGTCSRTLRTRVPALWRACLPGERLSPQSDRTGRLE